MLYKKTAMPRIILAMYHLMGQNSKNLIGLTGLVNSVDILSTEMNLLMITIEIAAGRISDTGHTANDKSDRTSAWHGGIGTVWANIKKFQNLAPVSVILA
jgi:hypothetical protein